MKRWLNIPMALLALLMTSCQGHEFYYDPSKQAIVSTSGNFSDISIEIEGLDKKYLGECDLGERNVDILPITSLSYAVARDDSTDAKLIYKASTIMIIRNSGGDAGPYTIKLLIDKDKNIRQIQ